MEAGPGSSHNRRNQDNIIRELRITANKLAVKKQQVGL